MEELVDLVHSAQGSNVDAYERLVRRFQGMALGYARSILGDFHLAEDAVQEAFVQAYLELGNLREPLAFATWLRRIVFKQCDRTTRQKRPLAVTPDEIDAVEVGAQDPIQRLEEVDVQKRLAEAIKVLPDAEREVTKLFYLNSFSQREIADFLEIPQTTVNYRLYAVRRRLKEEMANMATTKKAEREVACADISDAVREKIEKLERLHGELAAALKPVFSLAMSRAVDVEVSKVRQVDYATFIESLSRHSCTYYFNMEPMQGWVTCDLSMPLALASLNRFQDPDELEQEVEMRSHIATDLLSITPYHIGLVNELIKFIIIKLEDVWSPILPIKVQNINIETVPRLILKNAELTNAEEAVMQIDMDVKVPRFKGLVMSLCYPVFMLEETLPQS